MHFLAFWAMKLRHQRNELSCNYTVKTMLPKERQSHFNNATVETTRKIADLNRAFKIYPFQS